MFNTNSEQVLNCGSEQYVVWLYFLDINDDVMHYVIIVTYLLTYLTLAINVVCYN